MQPNFTLSGAPQAGYIFHLGWIVELLFFRRSRCLSANSPSLYITFVVAYRNAKTPTVILNTGQLRDIRECSVVIVVKERGLVRCRLAVQRFKGRTVHQVDVHPSVVVVIQ